MELIRQLFCFCSEAGIERNRTFLQGFKMVPSLTYRVEPETGDLRTGVCQRNRPWERWALGRGGGGVGAGGRSAAESPRAGGPEQSAP